MRSNTLDTRKLWERKEELEALQKDKLITPQDLIHHDDDTQNPLTDCDGMPPVKKKRKPGVDKHRLPVILKLASIPRGVDAYHTDHLGKIIRQG